MESNPFDPEENVRAGATYLRSLLDMFDGDARLALAAYNAGEAAVIRAGTGSLISRRRRPMCQEFSRVCDSASFPAQRAPKCAARPEATTRLALYPPNQLKLHRAEVVIDCRQRGSVPH